MAEFRLPIAPYSPMAETLEIEGVRLSSPDRVVYPGQGITKRQLAEYYLAVADWILPRLKDRPLTLLRCPRGQEKECFVQRRAADSIPEEVARVEIPDEEGGSSTHLAVNSLQGLLALIQIGVLELHTWGSRRDRLDRPDRMVIDLDPGPDVSFAEVVEAALRVRTRLLDAGLTTFVMTTGGKGLHVVAPLRRTVGWSEVRDAARSVAAGLEAEDPDSFIARAARAEREGRIYVDFLRNGWGASSVAPYSTRARTGAPVATPLTWRELEKGLEPAEFTVLTVPDRLRSLETDPWSEYRRGGRGLTLAVRSRLEAH